MEKVTEAQFSIANYAIWYRSGPITSACARGHGSYIVKTCDYSYTQVVSPSTSNIFYHLSETRVTVRESEITIDRQLDKSVGKPSIMRLP